MNEGSFVHHISSYLSLTLGIISLGIVVFNAGRWSGRMERAEKHIHDVKNALNGYVPRGEHSLEMRNIERQLLDINSEVKAATKVNRAVLLKLVGHTVDIEE